jgi:hypothetical protein
MAGRGAGTTSAVIFGGFLCLGLVLFAIAAAIVLSLISIYTPNHGQQGYGSVYILDAFMLKFFYQNSSGLYYNNGTVANSTDLSQRCTTYFQSLGVKNFAGCLIFNGRAWGPNNVSSSARRRRRATTAGMYFIGTMDMFLTVGCPKTADYNATSSSSSVSYCVQQGLATCNSVVNNLLTTFALWTSTNTLILDILDTGGYYDAITITTIYGVPRTTAYAISNNLPGVSSGTKSQLQYGCRYGGELPISTINALLASQTAGSTGSVTTQSTG